jgi:hypothetical protein
MDTTTALLVDGAFLLVDGRLTPQQSQDVVNSVLLARHVATQSPAADAAGYATALGQVLGNIGWTSTDFTRHSTSMDGTKGADGTGPTPLAIIAEELAGCLPSDIISRLVAEVAALERASPQVRQAWATSASHAKAQSCLLIAATLDDNGPALVYDYNETTPGKHATGYPWSPLTGPGTLTQFRGTARMNRTVFTADFSAALAAKVATTRSSAVVPLQP